VNLKLKKWDYILVEWNDSARSFVGWSALDEFDFETHKERGMGCISVGVFLKYDEDNLYITQTYHRLQDEILGVLSIPKKAILKISRLHCNE
jgi:hypothetical protein